MKQALLLFSYLFFFCSAIAQNSGRTLYVVHPSLGDDITVDEKQHYQLFPEYADPNFSTAVVYQTDSTYLLELRPLNGPGFERPITTAELEDIRQAVDATLAAEFDRREKQRQERNRELAEDIARFGIQLLFLSVELLMALSN